MAPDQGRLIVIDAIDGDSETCKEMLMKPFHDALAAHGRNTCDLDAHVKKHASRSFVHGDHPFFDAYDAIFVSEPTFGGVGLAIREEIKQEEGHDTLSVARAHALDRQLLYKRTILPFLSSRPRRVVIQMRGLITSLARQTLQSEKEGHPLSVKDLLELPELPGNRLELSRRPDLIILLTRVAETRLAARYRSPEIAGVFQGRDTRIVEIDAKRPEPEVVADCLQALNTLLAA
jgi:thymidylate kinase